MSSSIDMLKVDIIKWQDLAPADYHLFGPLKEGLRGKHSANHEEVKTAVLMRLKEQSTEFFKAGIHAFILRWNIAIERNGDGRIGDVEK